MLNIFLKFCIFIYRIVRSFFYGIYTIIYSLAYFIIKFIYSFFYGITLPIRLISVIKYKNKNRKFDNTIEKKQQEKIRIEEKRQEKIIKEIKQKEIAEEKKIHEIEEKNKKEKLRQQKIQKQQETKAKNEEAKKLKQELKLKKIEEKKELKRKKEEEKKNSKAYLEKQKRIELKKEKAEKKKQLAEEKKLKKQQVIEEKKLKKQQAIEEKKLKKQKIEEEKRNKQIQKIHDDNVKKEQKAFEASRKKKEKEERIRLRKERKAELKKQKIENKKKIEKRRKNDTYVNDKVEKEKVTLGSKLKKTLITLNSLPTIISDKIKNNSYVKNKRNKKDINRQALLIDFNTENEQKSDVKLLYKYEAKDPSGKMVTDYHEAFSRVEVHSYLLSEGYEVYSITTNKWITLLHGQAKTNKTKIKNKDLIFFLTQLSTYLKAGIPLVEALRILSKQFKKNKVYTRIFKSMIYELTMGESFSSAMSKQGQAFPKLLINMVKTSEMTGELPEVLDDMSEYFSQSEETRKQMVSALTYPSIVLVFAIGVITFIMIYIIPQFSDMYSSMDAAQIPKFTQVVINTSDFMKNYILLILLGIVLFFIIMIQLYKRVTTARMIMQSIAMRIPVIGTTMIYKEVTMFTKTFASLLNHNVSITESMELLNGVTNNEIYKMLILDTITNLAKGGKISDSFEDHWAFPLPAYEMIVTGESTGELPEMMSKVSMYYQGLHRDMVSRIKTFIEPILTIFLTVIVGVVVLAIVIPMFNMYQQVSSM